MTLHYIEVTRILDNLVPKEMSNVYQMLLIWSASSILFQHVSCVYKSRNFPFDGPRHHENNIYHTDTWQRPKSVTEMDIKSLETDICAWYEQKPNWNSLTVAQHIVKLVNKDGTLNENVRKEYMRQEKRSEEADFVYDKAVGFLSNVNYKAVFLLILGRLAISHVPDEFPPEHVVTDDGIPQRDVNDLQDEVCRNYEENPNWDSFKVAEYIAEYFNEDGTLNEAIKKKYDQEDKMNDAMYFVFQKAVGVLQKDELKEYMLATLGILAINHVPDTIPAEIMKMPDGTLHMIPAIENKKKIPLVGKLVRIFDVLLEKVLASVGGTEKGKA
ncbi:hypothetical protein Ddc_12548 [Ditylenchus destructor]|nr:hypothetical protein Ddc_12548 [Ditylenchus destructor]